VAEGIQNYVDMAAGLTKATRAKATAAAKNLLASAGLEEVAADATDRVGKLAEEVLAASRANRELMNKLIAAEVDKAAARLGFVRADELDDLRRELAEVRMSMAHASAHPDVPEPATPLDEPDDAPVIQPITEPGQQPPARNAAAKKAAAKKTAQKKAAQKLAPAKKSAQKLAPGKLAPAKRTPAKKAASKTSPTPVTEP
jgi:hypothetical protein